MSWLRIDDTFASHPKLAQLSDRERWVWMRTLCYCARYATDTGKINAPSEIIGLTTPLLAKLERIGLVDRNGDGIPEIHDWKEYNGRTAVERVQARERKQRQRDRERDENRDDERDETVTVPSRARAHDPSPSRPKKRKEANASSSLSPAIIDDLQRVYNHWRTERGKTDRRYDRVSDKRRAVIKARLRESRSDDPADELIRAIDGVALDPWDDRPRHDDLTVIFRNREKVDYFLEFHDRPELQRRAGGLSPSDMLRQAGIEYRGAA